MEGGGKFSGGTFKFSLAVSAFVFLQLLLCIIYLKNAHSSTVNVEVGSTVYEDIEFLSAVGLLDTAMIGALPLSREEIARFIVEAKLKAGSKNKMTALEERVIRRLEQEFWEDIEDLKTGNDTIYFKPMREAALDYLYLDQEPSVHPNFAQSTDAIQRAFTYNKEGIDYRKNNGAASFTLDGRIKMFSFFFKPLFTYREISSGNLNFTLHKGYGKFGSKVEIQFGQDSKWWGQGRHGSLLLSNNAEPLLMLNIRNAVPILIPFLGIFKFDIFLGQLEKDRDFERPYFSGMRLSFKPSPWVEFGLHRTAIFGGKGAPEIGIEEIVEILFVGRNDSGDPEANASNQIAGLDFRFHMTGIKTDLYFEWAGEDVHSDIPYPYKRAHIIGVYLADLKGFSIRSEFFDSKRPGIWYRHNPYISGYTFKEKVIGHHAGGDAEDLFIEIIRDISDLVRVSGSFDLERRGTNQSLTERHWQYMAKIRLRLYPYYVELSGGYEEVQNHNFSPGPGRQNYFAHISLKRYY